MNKVFNIFLVFILLLVNVPVISAAPTSVGSASNIPDNVGWATLDYTSLMGTGAITYYYGPSSGGSATAATGGPSSIPDNANWAAFHLVDTYDGTDVTYEWYYSDGTTVQGPLTNITSIPGNAQWAVESADGYGGANVTFCYDYNGTASCIDNVFNVPAKANWVTTNDWAASIGAPSSNYYHSSVVVVSDTTPPTAGNSGGITTSNTSTSGVTLNWTKASDDTSTPADLEYRVYQSSSNNLDTVSNIETNGTALGSAFTKDINSFNVTGLSPSTTYYFNVIVKDAAGNKSAYIATQATTLTPNQPPTASNNSVNVNEGQAHAFSTSDFGFSDNDSGDTLDHVRFTTIPTSGQLFNDANGNDQVDMGEALSAIDQVSKTDLDNSKLKFLTNNSTNTSFTFDVNDGTDYSTSSYTMTINVNARPTVTITADESDPTNTSPINYTVTFSESVTGFAAEDVSVTNGTVDSVTGSGTTYMVTISPSSDGTLSVDVPAGGAADSGGATNKAATQYSLNYDSTAATAIALTSNSIDEKNPTGTTVGTLSATDPNDGSETFSYSLSGTDASSFTINGDELRTNAEFDFETKNSYAITVTATDDAGNAFSKDFTITVNNVNEAPSITSNGGGATASVNVAENTQIVTTVTSTDPDTVDTVSYSLSGADAGKFSLSGSDLSFTTAQDYENAADSDGDNTYEVTVTATDDGTGTLTDSQDISVTVTNENDNDPSFTSAATSSIPEGTIAVTTVAANDGDNGINTVTFAITGGDDQALFDIDSSTGELMFKTAPNFEAPSDSDSNNIYLLNVTASDGTLTAVQNMMVTVTNVNQAPVITSNATIDVNENETVIGMVEVTDGDGDSITYAITGGVDAGKVSIDANTGALTFDSAPDYETPADNGTDNTYNIEVTVTDDGAGNLTDVQSMTINVINQNDNTPVLTTGAAFNVTEGTTAVTTVAATDADNNTVTFSITGGADQSHFSIDATTGDLTFTTAPDFETPNDADTNNDYVLDVTASDGTFLSIQTITVTVANVNEAPSITTNTNVSMKENETIATTVSATDGDHDGLTYSLTSGADISKLTIDANSGELTFTTAPDYETPNDADTNNEYVVEVTVSDGTLTDVKTFTITVTNENETPTITSNATVSVNENTTTVMTITTFDEDGDDITYSITGGTDSGDFSINASSGALTFKVAPNYENPNDSDANNIYSVDVTASDGTLTDVQSLTVTVTDENEAPSGGSIIINNGDEFTKSTNVTLTLTGTDPDAGDQVSMRFSDDNTTWSSWETFNTTKVYTLPSGDATKTIYMQLKDSANHITSTYSDTIKLDTTAPTGIIAYSTTAPTNQEVTATLTINELGATITNNGNSGTYVFTENGDFTFEFVDEAGNTGTATATVTNISKTAPVVSGVIDGGLYNTDRTITFDKGTATLTKDNATTNSFTSGDTVSLDGDYLLHVEDAAGNETNVSFTIDKTPPVGTISYSTTAPTNEKVIATLSINESAVVTNNNGSLSHEFADNGTYTFEFKDTAGNTGNATATVTNINKAAPIITGVSNGSVYNSAVTISFNKGTGKLNGNPFTSGSTVANEGNYTIVVTDEYGNSTSVQFKIDKTAPNGTISYSTLSPTNQDVIATITFVTNDSISLTTADTVTITNNDGSNQYVFTQNGSFTFEYVDGVGNIGRQTATVTNIDKVAPIVSGVTNGQVTEENVTVTFNEGAATLNGNGYTSGTVISNEGTYTFVVTDAAGNTTQLQFTIKKSSSWDGGGGNGGNDDNDGKEDENQQGGNQVEEITVEVESGKQGTIVSTTTIQRTTNADGKVTDKVMLTAESAKEAVEKLKEQNDKTARIVIPDTEDKVAEVNVSIPKEALEELKEGKTNLEIQTANATISIPNSTLSKFAEDIYFRVVPIKEESEKEIVKERAKKEEMVRKLAKDKDIQVIGRPAEIETNMQSQPVTITLPLREEDLPKDSQERQKHLNGLVIFIEHSDGTKELLKGKVVTNEDGTLGIEFRIDKFSTFTMVYMEGAEEYFSQENPTTIPTHTAYITGYPDGTFKPGKSLTRAEMATLLARNLPISVSQENAFTDLNETHWAYDNIQIAVESGLMKGYPGGEFRPNRNITRAEMAAIAYRWKNLKVVGLQDFKDTTNHWAAAVISALAEEGIMGGYPNGTFKPDQHLSRAEAVTVMNKVLERGPLKGVPSQTWPDVAPSHWAFEAIQEASMGHSFKEVNGVETFVEQVK